MNRESSPRRRVPAFTPVPLRYRRDGWTPARQASFLGHLAETRSVTAAARHVGKSRESAYSLRQKPGSESFAAAWDAVLAPPLPPPPKITADLLLRGGACGKLKPVMCGGKHVETRHIQDDSAFLRLYRRTLARARVGLRRGPRAS